MRHIFVYDLGGGTFDTTVIRIDGDDIQVVCTDGNNRLGGADWDGAITDFLLRSFTDQYPQLDPGDDEQFMQDLGDIGRTPQEGAQRHQSAASTTAVRRMRWVQVELTREQLEELTSELLERTMEITTSVAANSAAVPATGRRRERAEGARATRRKPRPQVAMAGLSPAPSIPEPLPIPATPLIPATPRTSYSGADARYRR